MYTASPGRIQRPSWSLSTTTYWWPPGVGVEVGLQGDAGQHLGGGPVDQPEPVVAGQADRGGQVVEVDAILQPLHRRRHGHRPDPLEQLPLLEVGDRVG